jgi:hypothetical protein
LLFSPERFEGRFAGEKKTPKERTRACERERVFSERESVSENEREETKEEKKLFFSITSKTNKIKLKN